MKIKRIIFILIIFIFAFFFLSCVEKDNEKSENEDYNNILQNALDTIILPKSTSENLTLKSEVVIEDKAVLLSWQSNNNAILPSGVVTRGIEDVEVILKVTASYNLTSVLLEKSFLVIVEKIDYEIKLNELLNTIVLPIEVTENISLPNKIAFENEELNITWESNNQAITSTGEVTRSNVDIDVELKASIKKDSVVCSKIYNIKVVGIDLTEIKNKIIESINLPASTNKNISLPKEVELDNTKINLTYKIDNNALSSDGKVYMDETNDITVEVLVSFTYQNIDETINLGKIIVVSFATYVQELLKDLVIPEETSDNIILPTKIEDVTIQWSSSNSVVLSKTGVCNFVEEDTQVKLLGSFYMELDNGDFVFYDKIYQVLVKPYTIEKRYELAIEKINLPKATSSDVVLVNSFQYGVTGSWQSSNNNVLSNIGSCKPLEKDTIVTLELTLSCEGFESKSFEYDINVIGIPYDELSTTFTKHNLIDRANDYVTKKFDGLIMNNGRVELASDALVGTYESKIFNTLSFTSVVGCWSCITSPNATIEVAFSVRVNNNWSKYFSYGEFGLGKTNYYYDTSDNIASLNTDEINISNNNTANGIKYKVTLKRKTLEIASPSLALVSCALKINNYTYNVDTSTLPNSHDIVVPKLYQYDVPDIGGSICSATTTTMLLKYKGFTFTDKGYAYEHQYMANMVADPGHNNPTYGNWSYNMATAGAFGVNAYVARMYSWDEVRYHLVNCGPLGASIKGTFGSYTTGGHLIVVRGYRIVNGATTVICNDPAVRNVYYEVTLQTFLNCWRNIVYVIE